MDVPVERGEALLAIPVDVVRPRITRLHRRVEEGAEQRVLRGSALQDERAVMTAPRIVGIRREARLHPPEVGQAVGVVPARHAGIRRPALVVQRIATLEDLPVDAAAAAEDLAARVEDAAAVHERFGFGLVHPVVEAAADRKGEGRGHVDERVDPPVRPSRLDDEDARAGILAEPVAQHRAGRTATDDDVVVARARHAPMLARAREPHVPVPAHDRRHARHSSKCASSRPSRTASTMAAWSCSFWSA